MPIRRNNSSALMVFSHSGLLHTPNTCTWCQQASTSASTGIRLMSICYKSLCEREMSVLCCCCCCCLLTVLTVLTVFYRGRVFFSYFTFTPTPPPHPYTTHQYTLPDYDDARTNDPVYVHLCARKPSTASTNRRKLLILNTLPVTKPCVCASTTARTRQQPA